MENKNLIYIFGGVAVLGIAYYMYKKRQATPKASATPVAETKSSDETTDVTAKPKMELPKSEENVTTATNPLQGKPASPNKPKVQLTKNEVEFMLLKKCGTKPFLNMKGKIEKYEQCKNSFKADLKSQGLISFDGMNTYSNMTSDFDISFR